MKNMNTIKCLGLSMILIPFLFILTCPSVLKGADIPSVEAVISGKAPAPTIEELSRGKVKIGDLIDKTNVDLVKEYLNQGTYDCVKRGMVMRMSALNLKPEQLLSNTYIKATERNKGKAVIDENGTVYFEKKGTLWPGGLPFPEPKTGLEAFSNTKYGRVWDEWTSDPNLIQFINSSGKVYKTIIMSQKYLQCTTRTKVAPLGAIKGHENIMWKRLTIMTSPREIDGLGAYTVRYYDDTRNPDTGFLYLPTFKKTIRVSATTWQDNLVGSDLTYGDGWGLQEPITYWKFKLLGAKLMLVNWEPDLPYYFLDEKRKFSDKMVFDVGKKFPRTGWAIAPVHIVEATPTIKHIYGKKILYILSWPYWPSNFPIVMADNYDRQMTLWKTQIATKGKEIFVDGETEIGSLMTPTYDLQADHMSLFWLYMKMNTLNFKSSDITMKKMLGYGR